MNLKYLMRVSSSRLPLLFLFFLLASQSSSSINEREIIEENQEENFAISSNMIFLCALYDYKGGRNNDEGNCL